MRLIGLSENNGEVKLEFFGCNLKCPYCVHITQPFEEYSIDDILDYVRESGAQKVFLGGAEPTIQKDLLSLIEELSTLGVEIVLKSDGMKPDVLERAMPYVKGFVLELKAPMDNIASLMELTGMSEERVEKYVANLSKSLELAKRKWLRIWIRVIPGYVTGDNFDKILPVLEGSSEVLLYQFLSNPDFDLSFKDFSGPVPSWDEMEELAKIACQAAPKIIVIGEKGKKSIQCDN
ncbi:pyruvate formate lyase activating enzyme [Methanohalophilus levihalophilus]|uniref:radical SAM protein n=1 Tax=Methanohalophilus levihalophilus TaxID=1431282 RepID=UPI001AE7E476|nr:radical SAM protein [Methanohalophilus levihalophilus]MBP2031013.1 pyruvate formate lyase activating enzyme [Methanohalophilus levihalophilus]